MNTWPSARRKEKTPHKPFKGSLNIRISPELHRALAERAQQKRKSLNAIISEVLESSCRFVAYFYSAAYTDAAALAAAYVFGLCSNHDFFDGNKRTAWVVAETFLDLNGYVIEALDDAVVSSMLATAFGGMPEEQLAKWIRSFLL